VLLGVVLLNLLSRLPWPTRRLKEVTENAKALVKQSRSLIRSGACADEDCLIPDSTQHVGSLVPRSPWHGPAFGPGRQGPIEAHTPADRLP
jgi:hypothetical protein